MPLPTKHSSKPPPLTLAKAARLASGVSQRQFAARVGLNRRTVARVESGVGAPTLRTAKRIAAGLDMPLGALFGASPDDRSDALDALREASRR
jgi:putative transcriptional regulator